MKEKVVALIPARAGSKGIPGKNIRLLKGKPLVSYPVSAALESKLVAEVYVSTENSEIADIAARAGARIIKRPAALATDTASTESVLLHFAREVACDIIVLLQCTSPLTVPADIDGAINLFIEKNYDSVLSVCLDQGGFLCGGFIWDEEGKPVNYELGNRPRRQEKKRYYRENGAIYVMSRTGLLRNENRLFGRIGMYVMPRSRSFEIDEPEDFELLERILV